MYDALYTAMVVAYVALDELRNKIERGDADSSGSTLRTVGIVALIVLVVTVLGLAVYGAASNAADKINATTFKFS